MDDMIFDLAILVEDQDPTAEGTDPFLRRHPLWPLAAEHRLHRRAENVRRLHVGDDRLAQKETLRRLARLARHGFDLHRRAGLDAERSPVFPDEAEHFTLAVEHRLELR